VRHEKVAGQQVAPETLVAKTTWIERALEGRLAPTGADDGLARRRNLDTSRDLMGRSKRRADR